MCFLISKEIFSVFITGCDVGCELSLCVCSQLCPTLHDFCTVAHQAPLSMGLSSQEKWSKLMFRPLGDLPDPGIRPLSLASPALQVDSLLLGHQGL